MFHSTPNGMNEKLNFLETDCVDSQKHPEDVRTVEKRLETSRNFELLFEKPLETSRNAWKLLETQRILLFSGCFYIHL